TPSWKSWRDLSVIAVVSALCTGRSPARAAELAEPSMERRSRMGALRMVVLRTWAAACEQRPHLLLDRVVDAEGSDFYLRIVQPESTIANLHCTIYFDALGSSPRLVRSRPALLLSERTTHLRISDASLHCAQYIPTPRSLVVEVMSGN